MLSASMDLTSPDIMYKWNHTLCDPFRILITCGCAGFSLLLGLLSSCGKLGLLPLCSMQASRRAASLAEHQALGHPGVSSCSSWAQDLWLPGLVSVARRIFLE